MSRSIFYDKTDFKSLQQLSDFRYIANLFSYTSGLGLFAKSIGQITPGIYRLGDDLPFLRVYKLSRLFRVKKATIFINSSTPGITTTGELSFNAQRKPYALLRIVLDKPFKQYEQTCKYLTKFAGSNLATYKGAYIEAYASWSTNFPTQSTVEFSITKGMNSTVEEMPIENLNRIQALQVGYTPIADFNKAIVSLLYAVAVVINKKEYVVIPSANLIKGQLNPEQALSFGLAALLSIIQVNNIAPAHISVYPPNKKAAISVSISPFGIGPSVQFVSTENKNAKQFETFSFSGFIPLGQNITDLSTKKLSTSLLKHFIRQNICRVIKEGSVAILPKEWIDKNKKDGQYLRQILIRGIESIVVFPYTARKLLISPDILEPVVVECHEKPEEIFYGTWYAIFPSAKVENVSMLLPRVVKRIKNSPMYIPDGSIWKLYAPSFLEGISTGILAPAIYVPITHALIYTSSGFIAIQEDKFTELLENAFDGISVVLRTSNGVIINYLPEEPSSEPPDEGTDTTLGDKYISSLFGPNPICYETTKINFTSVPVFGTPEQVDHFNFISLDDPGNFASIEVYKGKYNVDAIKYEDYLKDICRFIESLKNCKKFPAPVLVQFKELSCGALQTAIL